MFVHKGVAYNVWRDITGKAKLLCERMRMVVENGNKTLFSENKWVTNNH